MSADLAVLLGVWTWRPEERMYAHVSGKMHVFQAAVEWAQERDR